MNPLNRININVSPDKQRIMAQLQAHPKTKDILGKIGSIDQIIDSISGRTFLGKDLQMNISRFIEAEYKAKSAKKNEPFDPNDIMGMFQRINQREKEVDDLAQSVFDAVVDTSDKALQFPEEGEFKSYLYEKYLPIGNEKSALEIKILDSVSETLGGSITDRADIKVQARSHVNMEIRRMYGDNEERHGITPDVREELTQRLILVLNNLFR